ncbi:hypothetical protein CGZ94_19745 [Enemella evansiae]|uniref:Uncharacterized protein n=1 Tax=Enemella evansiae TaxID=2016499 RepID=A0A255G3G3_9ACTN|nr:hypothetical protein [Enemella evansiae]OYO08743.1 hypothetical protein CGZ94_19745 [Enemella evansiae]
MRDLSAAPMSETEAVLGWGWQAAGERFGCQLEFDENGTLTGLQAGGGEQIIDRLAVAGIRRDGELHRWEPRQLWLESDEVEARGDCAGLQLRVRHNLDHTWQLRVLLRNASDHEIAIDGLVLDAAAGKDALLTVYAAGALGLLGWHRLGTGPSGPSGPAGPQTLGLRLGRGDLELVDGELRTPPLRLGPGKAYTLTLHGEWYADQTALAARLPQWFPPRLDLDVHADPDPLLEHPDAALEWSDPGRSLRTLSIAGPEGLIRLDVAFADEEPLLRGVVDAIRGQGRLADASQALVLQHAAHRQLLGADEAAQLLTEYAERTPDDPSPRRVLVWIRMHADGLDLGEDLLQRAADELAGLSVGPGHGLATLHLWIRQRLTGQEPDPTGPLTAIAAVAADPVTDPLLLLELGTVLPALPGDPRRARAERLADLLTGTRPAEPHPAYPDQELARLLAVRSLAQRPDTELLRRLLARAADAADPLAATDALSWLALREVEPA